MMLMYIYYGKETRKEQKEEKSITSNSVALDTNPSQI